MSTKITSDLILNTGQPIDAIDDLIKGLNRYDNAIGTAADAASSAFKQNAAAVVDFNKQLADGTKIYAKVGNSAKDFRAEIERLNKVEKELIKSQKQFIAEGRYEELEQNIAGVKKRVQELKQGLGETEQKANSFGTSLKAAFGAVAAYFAIDQLISFGTEVFNITAEFQKFESVLTNALGSGSVARAALQDIKDVAASTPFSVAELSESFVKLANRGVVLAKDEIVALGDVASVSAVSFNQLGEAVLDAMSGQNERLLELGIKAEKMGKTTAFTFRGVTTEVENSEEAIKKYFIGLGKVEGVAGAMAAQMDTLGGMASNFGDTLDSFYLAIGQSMDGALKAVLTFASAGVQGLTTFVFALKEVPGWINENKVAIGALIVAVLALNLNSTKAAASTLLHTAAEKARGVATKAAAAYQWALNAAMTANPIGLIIAGIAALVAGFVLAYNHSEKFRAGMLGLWEVLKNVAKIAGLTFEMLLNPLKAGQNIAEIKRLALGLGDAFNKGYNDSLAKDKAKRAAQEKAEAAKKAKEAAERAAFEAEQKRKAEAAAASKAALEKKKQAEKDAKEQAAAELKARKEALKALEKELLSLEAAAAKAKLDALPKNSKAYLDAVKKEQLAEIDQLEKHLLELRKKAGLKGGLTDQQNGQLNVLRGAVDAEYTTNLAAIERAKADELLELQAESDRKELEQLARKYDARIAEARKNKDEELALALETAKARELAAAGKAQKLNQLDSGEAIAIESTKATFGDAGDSIALERAKQQAILDVQIEFAEKRMALLENELDEESRLKYLQTKNLVTDLKSQKADLEKEDSKFNMLSALGVAEEDQEDVKQAFAEVLGFVGDFTAQQLELANQAYEARKEETEKKSEELDREIELNKLGFASNVETKRAELEEAKKAEAAALEEKKKAAKAQAAVDTVNQVGALISSSANILKGFSAIPIIGLPLGLAAVAAMFAAFVAMKAKASAASKYAIGGIAGDTPGFISKGRSHSAGGNKYRSLDGNNILEIEAGEGIINKRSTSKHAALLDAINQDNEAAIFSHVLGEMLGARGIRFADAKVADKARAAYDSSSAGSAGTTYAGVLQRMDSRLQAIEQNTVQGKQITQLPGKRIERTGNHTRTIHTS